MISPKAFLLLPVLCVGLTSIFVAGCGDSFDSGPLGQTTDGSVPFTSGGIASLPGHDICSLQGEFPKQFGLYLDDKKEHSVEYRERDGVIALFLLGKSLPPKDCGTVDAVLDLTPLIKKGEDPLFKCHLNSEGRTRWGRVVGLGDNQRGHKRFLTPRLAWRVNIKEKRFDEIKEEPTSCDASGYIVGNGCTDIRQQSLRAQSVPFVTDAGDAVGLL
jgi:hypothetical protein